MNEPTVLQMGTSGKKTKCSTFGVSSCICSQDSQGSDVWSSWQKA